MSVPVVDFSAGVSIPVTKGQSWNPTDEQKLLAADLISAFSTVGFVCIANIGISCSQVIFDDIL